MTLRHRRTPRAQWHRLVIGAADTVEEFTPALMTVLSPPRWFTGTDGTVHLVYELQLTNAFPVASTVTQVVVRDAVTGAALQTLSGDRLTAAMSLLTSGTEPTTDLAPSTVGVIWFDVPLYDASAVPASSAVRHRLQQDHGPGLPGVRDRSENESWPTYDQPALAVADAQVIVAEVGSGPDPRGGHTGRMVLRVLRAPETRFGDGEVGGHRVQGTASGARPDPCASSAAGGTPSQPDDQRAVPAGLAPM